MAITRAQRWKDFEMRAKDGVVELPPLGRYAPVHPMADQAALLKRLRLKPADCIAVDLYWAWHDVAFVEIKGPRLSPHPPIHSIRLNDNGYVYMLARVPEVAITSAVVARVLGHFARHAIERSALTDTYVALPHSSES